jgi:hypothetical protein
VILQPSLNVFRGVLALILSATHMAVAIEAQAAGKTIVGKGAKSKKPSKGSGSGPSVTKSSEKVAEYVPTWM